MHRHCSLVLERAEFRASSPIIRFKQRNGTLLTWDRTSGPGPSLDEDSGRRPEGERMRSPHIQISRLQSGRTVVRHWRLGISYKAKPPWERRRARLHPRP